MTGVGLKKGVNNVTSSGGSDFDTREGVESFPGVPYTSKDTNSYRCNHDIAPDDYAKNASNVRNLPCCSLITFLETLYRYKY